MNFVFLKKQLRYANERETESRQMKTLNQFSFFARLNGIEKNECCNRFDLENLRFGGLVRSLTGDLK